MPKKEEFIHLFTDLVSSFRVPDDITQGLEKFVCALYGNQWLSSVNEMCYKMFVQNFDNKMIVYPSLLPIKRADYVAVNLQISISFKSRARGSKKSLNGR